MDEVVTIIENVIKKFSHHNLITEPKILGVQEINEIFYCIRIVCETKSFEHFEITRLLKTEIVKKLNTEGIEYLNLVFIKK